MSPEMQNIVAVGIPASLVLLIFILGATRRAVIYYDIKDLGVSTVPWLILLFGMYLHGYLGNEGLSTAGQFWTTEHNAVTDEQILIMQITTITSFLTMLWNIWRSMKQNRSIILGLLIGIFKLMVSLISIVILVSQLAKMFDDKNDAGSLGPAGIIILLAMFIGLILVNGHDVEIRRAARKSPEPAY